MSEYAIVNLLELGDAGAPVEGLEVRPERMRENLDATHGLIMSEHVASLLAPQMGREQAHDLVRALSRRASDGRENLKELLLSDPMVCSHLSPDAVERAMDPASYLGSAGAFIDRTLALYRGGETA